MLFSFKYWFLLLLLSFLLLPATAFPQLNMPEKEDEANRWADSVYQSLTNSERIAQLIFIRANHSGQDYLKEVPVFIEKYNLGGVVFFAGDPVKQALKTNEWNALAKTPLMISIDAEWGLGMRLKNTIKYPLQMTLGAVKDDSLIYEMGRQIGEQCKRIGIHMNFAPVVDVNNNPLNPVIGMRSFGENPGLVSVKGYFYMKGLQDAGVIASAKHFPGHGDTQSDSHITLPVLKRSKKELAKTELVPFKYLIDKGVASIMVAHLSVPAFDKRKKRPSSLSSKIITKQLKQKMGYKGLIITDGLDMKGVANYYPADEIALEAFVAGNDILLIPEDIPASIISIEEALNSGKIKAERLEESCKKILKYKYLSGASKRTIVDTSNLVVDLNKTGYQRTKEKLLGQAITVVKNDMGLIPLSFPDTIRTAVIIIGSSDKSEFEQPFTQIIPTKVFRIEHDATVAERQKIVTALDDINLVVIAVVNTNMLAAKRFKISEGDVQFIDFLARRKAVVLDIFASPYSLDFFSDPTIFDAIVISYQDKAVSQQVSAEIILGMHASDAQLPVTAGSFIVGTGISTPKTRFSIATPLDLAVDTTYLRMVDSIALNGIDAGAYPGCQVFAAKDGYIFYHKSFGTHTYDKKIPVKETDVYDLASLTKILATTPAIMKLSDDGKIDIDDKLSNYLLFLRGTNKSDIGFRDLLTHQAGLTPWIPYYESTLIDNQWDTAVYRSMISEGYPVRVAENMYIRENYKYRIYEEIINSELSEAKYSYSDLGFYFLKEMVEHIINEPFDSYLYHEFYNPLGLFQMKFNPRKYFPLSEIIPTEYDRAFRHQLLHGDVHDQGVSMLGGISGHAGLFGNAYDVAVIMQMFLNGGQYGGREFIKAETVTEFTRYQFPENDNRRGLGFDKPLLDFEEHRSNCKDASPSSFGHSGFTGTYTWADPDNGLVYVFLSNRVHPDMDNKKIMDLDIRTNIHQLFYEAIK